MHYPAPTPSLFAQLQSRFPTSSLITELVQSQDGSYVVRALVQMGGTVLTTAMAAAGTIEQAEDEAKVRVLQVLGITPDARTEALPDIPSLLNGTPLPHSSFEPERPLARASQPSKPEVQAQVSPRLPSYSLDSVAKLPDLEQPDYPEPVADVVDEISADFSQGYDDGEGYEAEEFVPAIADSSPASLPTPNSVTSLPDRPTSVKPLKPEPAIAPEPEEPEDLSSLIALTDVEMDRIGWTKQEGRDYLKRTYKKSTRQKLDVGELMDFLNYLRALPSVNGL